MNEFILESLSSHFQSFQEENKLPKIFHFARIISYPLIANFVIFVVDGDPEFWDLLTIWLLNIDELIRMIWPIFFQDYLISTRQSNLSYKSFPYQTIKGSCFAEGVIFWQLLKLKSVNKPWTISIDGKKTGSQLK